MRLVLSEAAREVEEWLDEYTYDYQITKVFIYAQKAYAFCITEFDPNGETDIYTLVCYPDGSLINDNGDDVTKISLDVYSNEESIMNWTKAFIDKWYEKK